MIHSWSLPPGPTCPGESILCSRLCYAKRGRLQFSNVTTSQARNWEFSHDEHFVDWMVGSIAEQQVRVFRIHVAGDFATIGYIQKWRRIVERCRRVTFFAYTRSWRQEELLPDLIALAQLPNMRLWWSTDRETGPAPAVSGVRVAYMAINDLDAQNAPDDCDLVFRERPSSPLKKVNETLVCPPENGVSGKHRHTCTTCGICWRQAATPKWESQLVPVLAPRQRSRLPA